MPRPPVRSSWSLVLLLIAAFWAFDLGVLRAGVPAPLDDVWEYGVTARHLLHGDGFRTSVIHPPLWNLRDAASTVPVLVHGPALPVLFAPLLALGGADLLDRAAWLAALAALAAAVVLYRAGARAFGPVVGAGAALAFTLSPLTLEAVHHDVSLPIGTFLLIAAFDLLAREEPVIPGAAIALGLGALVRPELLLALPGLAMLAGGAGTVGLLLGVTLVSGPWWWHGWRATGFPFFNLSSYMLVGYSARWPGLAAMRDFALTPERWPALLLGQGEAIQAKALEALPHALKRAALAPSALTGWLAIAGFASGLARSATRWTTAAAFACALVPVALMTLLVYHTRYLVPFLPLWALAAAAGAAFLGERLPRLRHGATGIGVLVLLTLASTVPALLRETRDARALEVRLARERARLAPAVGPGAALPRLGPLGLEPPPRDSGAAGLLVADAAGFVAWTTGRPTLWMTAGEYARLRARAPAESLAADTLPSLPPEAGAFFTEHLR